MWARQQRKASGFTIIEVMIVLAVTGVLFVSVVLLIGGKQAGAEFQTSIRDVQSQIEQIINETASGYFTDTAITCIPFGSSVQVTAGAPGIDGGQCVFLGKALHFTNANGSDHFEVIPIVGLQQATGSSASGLFSSAAPVLLAATSPSNPAGMNAPTSVDAITNQPLEYGLTVQKMQYTDSSGIKHSTGSLAFVQGLGTTTNSGGGQDLDLVVPVSNDTYTSGIGNGTLAAGTLKEAAVLDGLFQAGSYNDSSRDPSTNVQICFASGTTHESGLMTLNNSGNNLAIQVKIFSSGNCT